MSLFRSILVLSGILFALAGCSQVTRLAGLGDLQQGGNVIRISADGPVQPTMQVSVESRNQVETLRRVSDRGAFEIWRGGSGDTLTLQEGVIVATTALTPDLISVETSLPSDWVRAPRPAVSDRVLRFLDGDEQLVLRGYRCEYSAAVSENVSPGGDALRLNRTDENCYNTDQTFKNSYWLDGAGRMVLSRQWLGPEVGYLRLVHHTP